MSYGYDLGIPAAQAQADERATFIRRTYGHLAVAILGFVALTAGLCSIPGIEGFIAKMTQSQISWLVVMGMFMFVSWIAERWAQSNTSLGMQYAGLALYVVAQSIVFLPLIYIAAFLIKDQTVLPTAGILTLGVFGGLSTAVLVTKKDFSFLGPILSVAGWLALAFIVAAVIFGFSLGLIFSFAMVAFASAAILYQTSNVLHYYPTNMYVAAALALFAAVALLFWYILRILIATRE
ncbi:MAG: US12 family protein [Planctomycetia bacterium]|nr:US12 family protein [Planctomycetia bacterium]